MKKLLVVISPIFVVLSVFMWISWGLKGMLTFFVVALLIVVSTILLVKWIEFVDKHIKD